MQFEYTEIFTIPRLAWCAKFKPGHDIISILHGSGVEVHDNWFCEGAWDGTYDLDGFINSENFTGTGGRIIKDSVEFVSPTNPFRGLVSTPSNGEMIISNSLIFVLAQINDKPDVDDLGYYRKLYNYSQNGFAQKLQPIKMANGSQIKIHNYCNIRIKDGRFSKNMKPESNPPVDYSDYQQRLIDILAKIRENAADPRRIRTVYHPLVTLSRGYDSVACAALATQAGWKDAVTLVPDNDKHHNVKDSGVPVARCLGLNIEKFDMVGWRKLENIPEAEFAATAWGGIMVRFVIMEQRLKNSLLVLGNVGGLIWGLETEKIGKNWARSGFIQMGAESLWEFQLRAGFLTVYPATFLATHFNQIRSIMTSDEMKPWSIGGDYDRPIARRIAEEAGVGRELFGQEKLALTHEYTGRPQGSSINGHKDFVNFLHEIDKLKQYSEKKITDGKVELVFELAKAANLFFHWGVERTLPRYKF